MRLSAICKSWYFAQIELYIYVVGRWLTAAEEISENENAFGCYQI